MQLLLPGKDGGSELGQELAATAPTTTEESLPGLIRGVVGCPTGYRMLPPVGEDIAADPRRLCYPLTLAPFPCLLAARPGGGSPRCFASHARRCWTSRLLRPGRRTRPPLRRLGPTWTSRRHPPVQATSIARLPDTVPAQRAVQRPRSTTSHTSSVSDDIARHNDAPSQPWSGSSILSPFRPTPTTPSSDDAGQQTTRAHLPTRRPRRQRRTAWNAARECARS